MTSEPIGQHSSRHVAVRLSKIEEILNPAKFFCIVRLVPTTMDGLMRTRRYGTKITLGGGLMVVRTIRIGNEYSPNPICRDCWTFCMTDGSETVTCILEGLSCPDAGHSLESGRVFIVESHAVVLKSTDCNKPNRKGRAINVSAPLGD